MKLMLVICTAVIAAIGLGLILSDALRVPSYAVSKATHNLGKRQNRKTNPLEIWMKDLSNRIAERLRLNEYKRLQLKADLQTADINLTPEAYVADNLVKALLVGIFAIPVFFLSKPVAALILLSAGILYHINSRKVSNQIREKRRKIEYELPRLVATVEKTLHREYSRKYDRIFSHKTICNHIRRTMFIREYNNIQF